MYKVSRIFHFFLALIAMILSQFAQLQREAYGVQTRLFFQFAEKKKVGNLNEHDDGTLVNVNDINKDIEERDATKR